MSRASASRITRRMSAKRKAEGIARINAQPMVACPGCSKLYSTGEPRCPMCIYPRKRYRV